MKSLIQRLTVSFADFVAAVAAKYHRYLDEANAKTRAEAQQNYIAALSASTRPAYDLYAEVMMEAINNTADATHLRTVENVFQVLDRNWLVQFPTGLWGFQFRGRYLRGFGMTRADIARILQAELNQLCSNRGCDPLVIAVRLENDGRLVIQAVFAADAFRYRMEKIKEVEI